MDLGQPAAAGNTAQIYLCEGRIIKLFNSFLPENEAEHEAAKQRYAYLQGLPVPRVLEVTKMDGRQAVIMEYIEGKTIGCLLSGDMSMQEQFMRLSVDVQMMIHNIKADGIELMTDKLSRQLSQASALSGRQKDFLIQELRSMQSAADLCHGDFHVFNLIQTENGIVIIDWADSSVGDRKADVCRSYLLYLQHSKELAELYLKLYCEQSGLFQRDILKWEPIIAGARLSENVPSENRDRLLDIVNRSVPV